MQQKSIAAFRVRMKRKSYIFGLFFSTLVAAGIIAIFTGFWYSTDPELMKSRPDMSSTQYFLILYGVVIALWLIVYLLSTISFSSGFPKGTYSWALELTLTILGVLPGIVYTLVVAHKVMAEAPGNTRMPATPIVHGYQRVKPPPPPPKLRRGSRRRRFTSGR